MSLVAYDQSDDSNEEDDEENNFPSQLKISTDIPISINKKQKESVKITIPSLKEFEDDECPVVSKKPKIESTSGLFGMLPPPKNTSTLTKPGFVPYVLSSKKSPAPPASLNLETKTTKNEKPKITTPYVQEEQNSDEEVLHTNDSSDKSHETLSTDFFSLDSVKSGKDCSQQDLQTGVSISPVEGDCIAQSSSLYNPKSSNTYPAVQEPFTNDSVGISYSQQDPQFMNYASSNVQEYNCEPVPDSYVHYSADSVPEPDLKESLLKDKEFLKLQGRRREFEAVDIIDVNANDQLTGKNEWLMKSLTEESTHRPSRKKGSMPTQQQKRKHQITYLAFQAKEREMDLKNQWAMNSRTRRETQAKYGF